MELSFTYMVSLFSQRISYHIQILMNTIQIGFLIVISFFSIRSALECIKSIRDYEKGVEWIRR